MSNKGLMKIKIQLVQLKFHFQIHNEIDIDKLPANRKIYRKK